MTDIFSELKRGGGKLSDGAVVDLAASRIGCDVRVLWAVLDVESAGRPYDDQGRLIILTEKHVFWRELPKALRSKARRLGLAVSKWSRANYKGLGGSGSNKRWDRLGAMVDLHETAGLRSASYGGPQIMGFNAELCGFPDVQSFVLAFAESEAEQQKAFIRYLEKTGLAQALRDKDFRAIARRYNGPGQVTRYAGMMRNAYNKLARRDAITPATENTRTLRLGSEGFRVKALQERLTNLGYHVKPDGDFGPATRRAVVSFQMDNGLVTDGVVGEITDDALSTAIPLNAQPGGTRENLTVKDLRKSGSQTIKQADRLTKLGVGTVATGAGATAVEELSAIPDLETLKGLSGLIHEVSGQLQPLIGLIGDNKWFALAAIGGAIYFLSRQIKQRRLHDAREWRHIG